MKPVPERLVQQAKFSWPSVVLCAFLLAALHTSVAFGAAITIQSTFQFPEDAKTWEAVALAGLSRAEGGFPGLLGVVWTNQESSSWFPAWELQLHSSLGLFPRALEGTARESRLLGTGYVKIGSPAPEAGHVYETLLSYDGERGGFALTIRDATDGEVVYKGQFVLPPLAEPFFPTAGLLRRAEGGRGIAFSPFEEVAAHSRFVPHAVEWHLVEARADGFGSVPLEHIDREAVSGVALRLRLPHEVSGTFRLHRQDGAAREEILEIEASGSDMTLPIDLNALPPGKFDLVLEYHDGGQAWFTDVQSVTVGRIFVSAVPIAVDVEAGVARGALALDGDGPFPEMWVTVEGELVRMVWDEQVREYRGRSEGWIAPRRERIALTSGAATIPLEIPLPASEPGLWRVRWRITTDTGIPVFHQESGAPLGSIFSTYPPPRRDPGASNAPFTIAVLPDTQYYTFQRPAGGRPELFLRQAEWIAKSAALENIVLVLHLGDITHNNHPGQWEVARESIRLLDGAVPYVLAIGNHDMGLNGEAESRETLFNEYFPPEPHVSRPSFGGAFRAGELENSYHFFSLGGDDYMVLALEFMPRDEVLAWANEVVAAHPGHKVLVITHYFTSRSGSPGSSYGEYALQYAGRGAVNSPQEVWEKFLRRHPNILMTLSGHLHHEAVPRQVRAGDHGNPVYQMLFDYQEAPNGGDGWLALLRFFPERERIGVAVFSPYLGAFKKDRSGGFAVPFCIDLAAGAFVEVDSGCAVELGG